MNKDKERAKLAVHEMQWNHDIAKNTEASLSPRVRSRKLSPYVTIAKEYRTQGKGPKKAIQSSVDNAEDSLGYGVILPTLIQHQQQTIE